MSDKSKKQEQKEEFLNKIGRICDENSIGSAVFLAISNDTNVPPYVWYKGNMLACGEMSARFTRLVKSEIIKKLDI